MERTPLQKMVARSDAGHLLWQSNLAPVQGDRVRRPILEIGVGGDLPAGAEVRRTASGCRTNWAGSCTAARDEYALCSVCGLLRNAYPLIKLAVYASH